MGMAVLSYNIVCGFGPRATVCWPLLQNELPAVPFQLWCWEESPRRRDAYLLFPHCTLLNSDPCPNLEVGKSRPRKQQAPMGGPQDPAEMQPLLPLLILSAPRKEVLDKVTWSPSEATQPGQARRKKLPLGSWSRLDGGVCFKTFISIAAEDLENLEVLLPSLSQPRPQGAINLVIQDSLLPSCLLL